MLLLCCSCGVVVSDSADINNQTAADCGKQNCDCVNVCSSFDCRGRYDRPTAIFLYLHSSSRALSCDHRSDCSSLFDLMSLVGSISDFYLQSTLNAFRLADH